MITILYVLLKNDQIKEDLDNERAGEIREKLQTIEQEID